MSAGPPSPTDPVSEDSLSTANINTKIKSYKTHSSAKEQNDGLHALDYALKNMDNTQKKFLLTSIAKDAQKSIFDLQQEPDKSNPRISLNQCVSVINTQYISTYTRAKYNTEVLPSGSASIINLAEYQHWKTDETKTFNINRDANIKYILQAAPGAMTQADLKIFGASGLKNSVYNCLYLANKHGVQGIAFPIIGGNIFFQGLEIEKNTLYEYLLQGVEDYFSDFKDSTIEVVLFAEPTTQLTDDNFSKTFDSFVSLNNLSANKLKKNGDGNIFSSSKKYNDNDANATKITALVNAANTELQFGDGLSKAFKDQIDIVYPTDLYKKINDESNKMIKDFHAAYGVYYKQKNSGSEIPARPDGATHSYKFTGKEPEKTSIASSPPPPTSPATPITPKVALAKVLTTLEGKLSDQPDASANISTLGITSPGFLYPTDGDDSAKKNLNSAQPTIEDMVTAFENAVDGDETDFYLGACRSIQAAYVLEKGSNADNTHEAMRAKLLLNLRKNSLLLKVPARWDYKEMKLGKVSGPPDTLEKLMDYSLQDTIEYYSQADVAGNAEFKALNIAKNPTDVSVGGATISGVDGRFVKGIHNVGTSCYFNTGLQLLLCDDDFLQFIITAISKPIEESEYQLTIDVKFKDGCLAENVTEMNNVVDNLTKLFKLIRNNNYDIKFYTNLFNLLLSNSGKITNQHDVSEIIAKMLTLFQCINNIYVDKLINNLTILTESYSTDESGNILTTYEDNEKAKIKSYTPFLSLKPDIQKMIGSQLTLTSVETQLQDMGFTLDKIKLAIKNNQELDDVNKLSKIVSSIDDDVPELTPIKENIGKILPSFSIQGILDGMKKGTKQDAPFDMSNYSHDDQTKINSLGDSIKKSCILYYLYKICNDEDTGNSLQVLLSSKLISSDDSLKTLNPIITKNYFDSDFNRKIQKFIDFIDSIKSDDKVVFVKSNCTPSNKNLFKDVYTRLETEYNTLTKSTKQKIEIVDIKETSKYIIFFIDRTLGNGVKLNAKVEINKKLAINSKNYILQGYSLHIGKGSNGGAHYLFVKCDTNSGNDALIIDDTRIRVQNYKSDDEKQIYVSAVIYKQEEPDISASPGGGGFKPRHNPITNNAASKSKHNSSFKASSSSKSKGKSHNRSHTQRVK
jgi:O-acetyl-ADP-ribose deacetylase (regulator of RNase III)